MFACRLHRRNQTQHVIVFDPVYRTNVTDRRCAFGQGSGFIKDHGINVVCLFKGFEIADQDSVTRGTARPRNKGGRGCQTKRTGTGDHQHRNCGNDGCLCPVTHQQPDRKGHKGDRHHHRHKHRRNTIHQFLHRRLAGLGLFDQSNDPRKGGVIANGTYFDIQSTGAIDRTTNNGIAGHAGHRPGFTGNQAFIQFAFTGMHSAVDRNAFARQHTDNIPHRQTFDGDILFTRTINQFARTPRAQCHQFTDRRGRTAFGAFFHDLASQDQGNDRC